MINWEDPILAHNFVKFLCPFHNFKVIDEFNKCQFQDDYKCTCSSQKHLLWYDNNKHSMNWEKYMWYNIDEHKGM
jgi:hypothetical protein